MNRYILFFFWFPFAAMRAQDSFDMPLGDTPVRVVRYGEDTSGVLLYNMHDNENTSALAGRVFAEKYGGSYYELIHTGKRNLSFLFRDDSVHIDPNRIYTDTGVWQQLEKNKITDTMAFSLVASWRDSLLTRLSIHDRVLVIALHNNTANHYSFKSYLPEAIYSDEALTLSRGTVRDKDDFFFVTVPEQYIRLSQGRYNVVLQSTETLTDDGSLSVYCGQLGIPYINVEAQHGHLSRQIKMLIFAYRELVEKISDGESTAKERRQQRKELKELLKASKS